MARGNIPHRPRVSRREFLFALIDQIPNNFWVGLGYNITMWFLVALDPLSATWFSLHGFPGVLIARILTAAFFAWFLCRNWELFRCRGEVEQELFRTICLLLLPLFMAQVILL